MDTDPSVGKVIPMNGVKTDPWKLKVLMEMSPKGQKGNSKHSLE